MKNRINILLILCCFLLSACNEDLIFDQQQSNPPVITDFMPKSGGVGTLITIKGENLSKVTKATLGNQNIEIQYRVNATEMVVRVTDNAKSGNLSVTNEKGTAQSTATFEISYASPVITTFPASALPNDEIVITGQNLDVVQTVMFDTIKAEIVSRRASELVVKVPFFENESVAIILSYFNGTTVTQVATAEGAFELTRPQPTVTNAPQTGQTAASITVTGTNLSIVDEAWFGTRKGTIKEVTETSLVIQLPAGITTTETGVFRLTYYGTKELIVNNAFVITPAPVTIYYWENRTMYTQDPTTTSNFFNAETGELYTPCQYGANENNIHFFATITSGSDLIKYLQINNPNNNTSAVTNFKCNDVPLVRAATVNAVKFKTLKTTSNAENKFIQAVKNKTLISISQQDITDAGISNASTNTPRLNAISGGYTVGDVLLIQKFASDGTTVLKVGFIEIVSVNNLIGTDNANKSSITFNCYFQK